ncbi:hypothetical protein JCM11641_004948 [Rhodosporidiobolus odoratus]
MAGANRPCNFFKPGVPGSCRFGTSCKFSHDSSAPNPSNRPSTATTSTRGGLASRGGRGGFQPPQRGRGLKRNQNNPGRSNFVPAGGVDRHLLRQVLSPETTSRLGNTMMVYRLVNALIASSKETATWSTHDSLNTLVDLASPGKPGLARLAEILTMPISPTAGSGEMLSFQRGQVNALYSVFHQNDAWISGAISSITDLLGRKSVADPLLPAGTPGYTPESFLHVLLPLTQLLTELTSRFANTLARNPNLQQLVDTLGTSLEAYAADICTATPSFQNDPLLEQDLPARKYAVSVARQGIQRLGKVIQRTQAKPFSVQLPSPTIGVGVPPGVLTVLRASFQPPGDLRDGGVPRHDNDFAAISKIRILPTFEELTTSAQPFIPANLPEAPHHLEGIEKQVDTIFRLTREDCFGPLRSAVQSLLLDFSHLSDPKNPLNALFRKGGGRHRPVSSKDSDSSDLRLYLDVQYNQLYLSQHHELLLNVRFRPPPGFGSRNAIAKNLQSGNLVGLLEVGSRRATGADRIQDVRLYLVVVAEDAKGNSVSVEFFDSDRRSAYLDAVRQISLERGDGQQANKRELYLIEVPSFLLGTVEPFLKALAAITPATLPFADILSAKPPGAGETIEVAPPVYARNPAFSFDLSKVLINGAPPGTLNLRPSDAESVAAAREELAIPGSPRSGSRRLAVPGGRAGQRSARLALEQVRVLLDAKVGKILVLAYTNHALDHLLRDIKNSVTGNIVRVGSRSQDDDMQALSLYNLSRASERLGGSSKYEIGRQYGLREKIEKEIDTVCSVASLRKDRLLYWRHLEPLLQKTLSVHLHPFSSLPDAVIAAMLAQADGGWQTSSSRKQPSGVPRGRSRIFEAWQAGDDLDALTSLKVERLAEAARWEKQGRQAQESKDGGVSRNRFAALGLDKVEGDDMEVEPQQGSDESDEFFETDSASDSSTLSDAFTEPFFDQEEMWEEPVTDRPVDELLNDLDVWCFSRLERQKLVAHWVEEIVAAEVPNLARLRARLEEVNEEIKASNNEAKLNILKRADVIGATTNSAANILSMLDKVRPTCLLVEEAGECLESQVLANLVSSVQHLILTGDFLQLRPQIATYGKLPLPLSWLKTQYRMQPDISKLVGNYLYPELENAARTTEYPQVKGMKSSIAFIDHTLPEDPGSALHSSHTNREEARWVVDLVRHLLRQGQYGPGQITILTPYFGQVKVLKEALAAERLSVIIDERDANDLAPADDEEDGEALFAATARNEQLLNQVTLRTVDRFQGEEAEVVILSLVRNAASPSHDDTEEQVVFSRIAKASIGFLKSPNRTNVALSRAKHGLFIFGNAALLRSRADMWESVISDMEKDGAVGPKLPACCEAHKEDFESHPKCGFNTPLVQLPCGHEIRNVACWRAVDPASIACREIVQKNLPACDHSALLPCPQDPAQHFCRSPCGIDLGCSHGTCKGDCGACKSLQARKEDSGAHVKHAHEKQRTCGHTCPIRAPEAASIRNAPPGLASTVAVQNAADASKSAWYRAAVFRQVCPTHARDKDQVVDLLLFSTLQDWDANDPDPLARLVTLGCGHAFTIETLDGAFELKHFFVTDENGIVGLAQPSGEVSAPTCPTCKRPERARLVTGQQQLARLESSVEELAQNDFGKKAATALTKLKARPVPQRAIDTERRRLLAGPAYLTPTSAMDAEVLLGLPPQLRHLWTRLARPSLQLYHAIVDFALFRSAHTRAYEGAVTSLFDVEKNRILLSGERVRDVDDTALKSARRATGMAAPTTDDRLFCKGVWLSMTVRYELVALVEAIRSVVEAKPASPDKEQALQSLRALGYFILATVHRDVRIALSIAEDSNAARSALEGRLH